MTSTRFERSIDLASNSGRHSLSFNVLEIHEHEPVFVADVRIEGVHWYGDDTQPILFQAREYPLSLQGLSTGLEALNEWLSLPVERVVESELDVTFDLGQLSIELGGQGRLITGPNVGATIHFQFGRLVGEFCFVTDQSCLRLFSDSARPLVTRTNRTA